MINICILTTVHERGDTRIFSRELTTLTEMPGARVTLVVADGKGDGEYNGVPIYDLGRGQNRFDRFSATNLNATRAVLKLQPDILHFHDPEILPLAAYIRNRTSCITIYDAHEDLPKDILDKHWIPLRLRPPVARAASWIEQVLSERTDHVIAATPSIRGRFDPTNSTVVANFPRLNEFSEPGNQQFSERHHVAYIGSMTRIRGVQNLVSAMSHLSNPNLSLVLAGSPSPPRFMTDLQSSDGWARTDFRGVVTRVGVVDILHSSIAGVVPFLPANNHTESQPNKLFEYMAAGIPVIASDFPLWKSLLDDVGCGITVNSEEPAAIAAAIDYLVANPRDAAAMGARGREAAVVKYNWEAESRALVDVYNQLRSRLR